MLMLAQPAIPAQMSAPRSGWGNALLDRYFTVNPKTINPFNQPHHDLVSSGDAATDAEYLRQVERGETPRFYITLVELVNRAGYYNVVCYDGFNGNIVVSHPATPKERTTNPAPHSADDRLLLALDAAIATAAEHGIAFCPDLAIVHSRLGREHLRLLEAYADGAGNEAVENVSWNSEAVR
jgi:hypothetical protein